MLDNILFLQHLHPGAQQSALRFTFGKALNRGSAGEQLVSVLGNAEQRIECLIILNARQLQRSQKIACDRPHSFKTVRIAIVVT